MGTNYYHHEKAPCECCGRGYERTHIGKSSGGWCFSLHVIPEDGIFDLNDWKKRLGKGHIEDEYGCVLTVDDLMSVICERSWTEREHNAHFLASNNAEPGPNGLLRHQIDGRHCIGHGEGTWDLLVGEFS